MFVAATACVHRKIAAIPPPVNTSTDNSYLDLVAGTRLRLVVPLLKNGDSTVSMSAQKGADGAIVLSANNLVGYRTSFYFVEGHAKGEVRLRFIGAQTTRNGKTDADEKEPAVPFTLPSKAQHVRLIYYVRASPSDHNMAIAGSKDMNALIAFTERFETDPAVCGTDTRVFCSWVPPGVALRPE